MLTTRSLSIATTGRGTFEITAAIDEALAQTAIETGLCHVFVHHTSASLVITENADPDVRRDLEAFFWRLVPDGDPLFVHTAEGPDDMPSHIRSALTQTSLTIPVRRGRLDLGTWQGVYLWEHRHTPHQRRLTLTVQGATPAEQAR
ncbi:MAG: YjbQ family protein [Deltaproteobacteria bacterium]|nr:YjbQ family protein [Deltaproteobacteria bacterium]MCB9787938.1 YjbQ family protein [Deltaproteobacteria bacterium]